MDYSIVKIAKVDGESAIVGYYAHSLSKSMANALLEILPKRTFRALLETTDEDGVLIEEPLLRYPIK